ncbi:MAG TPA: hypothetical protein VFS71_03575 [Flavobacterium sp.]|uniref:hypothetical protein n=1 Tax=Flavobacterium sp. TaxID=239 RepID=UPI002DB6FF10|nr:hypothetical protein [Flavobacterium sp.]HEU4788741.1 hypothetical protein [Flavobacterium sp.]
MKNKEAKSIFSSLENYSSIPPPELWDKIEAQLDEPKKKKRAIIWWSIAASLVVGLSVPTILYFNANRGNDLELNVENKVNGVVLQKNSNEKSNSTLKDNNAKNKHDKFNSKGIKNEDLNSNQVVTTTISNISFRTKDSPKLKKLNQWRINGTVQTVKNESQSNAIALNQNSNITKSEISIDKSAQVGNSNSSKNATVSNQNSNISEANKNKVIIDNSISKSELVIDKSVQISQSNSSAKSIVNNQNNNISEGNKNKRIGSNTISKSVIVIDKSVQVNQSTDSSKSIVSKQNNSVSGSSSNKGITESTSSKDSLNKIKLEVEQLEKALVQLDKDKTKKKTVSESINKWSLQVFAGVMSSQNYNNEKALGYTVASQQSNGYGVKTNYKLNKKWGVSSGFKINELGQKIAGVSYYDKQNLYGAVSGSLPLANDNYVPNSSTNYQFVSISKNEEYLFSSNSKNESGLEKGDVTQNLKYFEMPLEVSYAILSKKKTNIIMNTGGFVGKLISNDIALNGSSIGENKNVNEYVYGTLLSSTLQYELFKKTKFFIEPGMNYYINPLENQSFNQFQLMFNVGLNVSF